MATKKKASGSGTAGPGFRLPEPRFAIHHATGEPKDQALYVIPIFSDDDPETLAREVGIEAIARILPDVLDAGLFRAKSGQVLARPEQGLLLGGLGKSGDFHPESLAELFRHLADTLRRIRDRAIVVYLSGSLQAAIQSYNSGSHEFEERLKLDLTRAGRKKASAAKMKPAKDQKTESHDYVGPYDLEDAITQIVSCLWIGSDHMEVLKSTDEDRENSRAKHKKPIEISVRIHGKKSKPAEIKAAIERGNALGQAINETRFIEALPGNYLNPKSYEAHAKSIALGAKLRFRSFAMEQLEKMGCGGIVAVGKGSALPPRMLIVEHVPRQAGLSRPVVLVGKGITFDTGGISIKPSPEMHEMKYDMCGSALTLAAVVLAARRKLPVHVIGLLGLAENMPDGNAIKPGDVYTAYNGKTVEVQNTDAEGRLVLGDLLAYASSHYDPLCMIDFATLTGACIIALGNEAAGLMTASEDLARRLTVASRRSLERLWRLPHWSVYHRGLKSEVADLRNIAGRAAGTVTAMRFLSDFVGEGVPWAHLDIAGVAWRAKGQGSQGRGATGWGLRLMDEFLEQLVREGKK